MSEGGEGASLKYTPTWVVALVCTVIVTISLAVERFLHYAGKSLKKKNQKPLFEALEKVKEELMVMGFISLLMTVCQTFLSKICVHRSLLVHFLPCKLDHDSPTASSHLQSSFQLFSSSKLGRRLFSDETESRIGYCGKKDEVPLISQEALHQLHIFIFVLAIVHVTFCVLTILFGGAKIHQWKRWEDDISKNNYSSSSREQEHKAPAITHVHEHTFVKDHFSGFGKNSTMLGWLHSFVKQFYGSVTRSDYATLRLGFIMMHCRTNPKFNFHNYMVRALEDDFRKVVGISWYLWVFVVIFLLLNVNGWHTYFWIAFIPFALLLAVGTKLEHVIAQLASEVAEKHVAIEGDLVIQPSNDHFWFGRPRIVLFLIHFILFQNAFEIAFFFWIWVQYGFDSCIMGRVRYIIPRLIIGVFIQVLCSYSTLPLYAIVTQMGSHFKKAIFNENMQEGLLGWAQKAKKRKGFRTPTAATEASGRGNASSIQMESVRASREERDTMPLSDHN